MSLAMTQRAAFAAVPLAARRMFAARKAMDVTTRAAFTLPPLPYAMDALEKKGMSKTTFEFHYGKHHAAYVNNLNGQIAGKDLESMTIEEVMLKTWNGGKPTPEFNNAAQVVNHTFFWESMSATGGGKPTGKVADAIEKDLGGYEKFVEAFKAAGATQFGSGWAWLSVNKEGKLEVTKTPNAENPWVHGSTPILTMDVWEHAYYLDVQNRRPDFMTNFVENLIDWNRVEQRYLAATNEDFDRARRVFEAATNECPNWQKPWVSWAQMEKRCKCDGAAAGERNWGACRDVLQKGLLLNRDAPALLQAWGLMEMQRGNWLAALLLLDRSAQFEPRNRPVLRWAPVVEARKTVGQRCRRLCRSAASGSGCNS